MGLVHWDDPERWYEEGGGRRVQDWELMYTRGGFMSMYGKNNTIFKVKKKKRKLHKSSEKDSGIKPQSYVHCIHENVTKWLKPFANYF